MARPVSIVIPSLASVPLLGRALLALREEIRAPAVKDQVLVVHDTVNGVLCQAFDVNWPEVRVLVHKQDGGFAASALDGAQAADYRLMLLMHPNVVVRPGALTCLAAAMQDETVYAATPRVRDGAAEDRPVSRRTRAVEDGRFALQEPRGALPPDEFGPVPVPFAPWCATLPRREEFLASDGYDRLFAPLGFEDVDLGLAVWRRRRRIVEVPGAVVEHQAGGTLAGYVPDSLARAAHERNRLLGHWRHLSSKRDAHDHLAALWRDAFDAGLCGRREDLVHLAPALGELDAAAAARAGMADAKLGLEDALAAAR